jgi:hypothetical protein
MVSTEQAHFPTIVRLFVLVLPPVASPQEQAEHPQPDYGQRDQGYENGEDCERGHGTAPKQTWGGNELTVSLNQSAKRNRWAAGAAGLSAALAGIATLCGSRPDADVLAEAGISTSAADNANSRSQAERFASENFSYS